MLNMCRLMSALAGMTTGTMALAAVLAGTSTEVGRPLPQYHADEFSHVVLSVALVQR